MHAPVTNRWQPFWSAIIQNGGPEPNQYYDLNVWFDELAEAVQAGVVSSKEATRLLDMAGEATSSPLTMQGFVRTKPHGYAGDYEIIDRIYEEWCSPNAELAKWDKFFHWHAAPRAVRNRKAYFHSWLHEQESRLNLPSIQLLNVGSGPGRDVREYFAKTPGSRIICTGIDSDERAVAHATDLCEDESGRVVFLKENAIRFSPKEKPHLIWSAGLFDYLDDRLFVVLLRRLWRLLPNHGEIAVGNFSTNNPTRGYMEMGGWKLNHRDQDHLQSLALKAGVSKEAMKVDSEPEGINLFLHVRK